MAERHWTEEQLALMRWLCLPPQLREQKTLTAFAEYINTPRRTVYSWFEIPGFEEAKAKMAIQVQLELDADFRKAQMENMLTPTGWQERIAYYRYQFLPMLAMAKDGQLDDVRLLPASATPTVSIEQAQEELKSLPEPLKYQFLHILQNLGAIAVQNQLAPANHNYTLRSRDEGNETTREETGMPQYSSYNQQPKEKRRRYSPTPKPDPDNSNE